MSLRERREVVSLHQAAGAGAPGVLFSVVHVAGSSYRQAGARMLALGDGQTAGTLSGGCLEADLLRRAAWIVRDGAVVERFSTAFDDTAEIPYGLGCGGEIDLLAEPLDTPEATTLLNAMDATLKQQGRQVVTRLPGPGGSPLCRIVMDERGDVIFASDALETEEIVQFRRAALASTAHDVLCSSLPTSLGSLFVERLLPAQRLLIFGAGEDARPLSRLAAEMGWTPVVIDTRSSRTSAERFPGAQCLVASHAAEVPVLPEDAVVVMTHSYQQDRLLVSELLQQEPCRYLGLLGARHRSALLLQEASTAAGVTLAAAIERVHAPVGLELGGEGPEAVALAVVSEVQQALHNGDRVLAPSRRMDLTCAERLLAERPMIVTDACSLYASEPAATIARDAAPAEVTL